MKIGILGYGTMGSCLGQKLKLGHEVFAFDKDITKTDNCRDIRIAENMRDLTGSVEVLIIAVKPQDFAAILQEIKPALKEQLIISIAAGITTGYLSRVLGKARVIRIMPNMLAVIGKGITFLYKGEFATVNDLTTAAALFQLFGQTLIVNSETIMNAATATAGSGPGFVCDRLQAEHIELTNKKQVAEFSNRFIASFTSAAQAVGFDVQQAHSIAQATTNGTLQLLIEKKITPAELKKQVCSKGGTTEAGLRILGEGGPLDKAVQAALKRAEELAQPQA